VLRYRQTTQSVREIANALQVDAVLEGSIFREGERVRLSVQMVEPETARHLWTQKYERDMTSSTQMKVQDDVVTAIATELSAKIASKPKS
jgi:TolB-like protein